MASRLYSWADEGELVPEGFNPAAGVKRLKRKGGEQAKSCRGRMPSLRGRWPTRRGMC
jgi:hypothetical protein